MNVTQGRKNYGEWACKSKKVYILLRRTVFADGRCELTKAGEIYLSSKDLNLLYETISINILAFDDIYQFLNTAKEAKNEEQILEYLKENFDIEWTTYAQVNFRLLWLQNLKKVKKTDEGYIAIIND